MENFGRYVAVIMVFSVLFALPLQYGSTSLRRIRKEYVIELIREFGEISACRGEITLQEWETLQQKLQRGNGLLFLNISIGEERKSEYQEGLWKDTSHYRMTYNDAIIEILLKEGRYPMQTNDILMLQVREGTTVTYECSWKSV